MVFKYLLIYVIVFVVLFLIKTIVSRFIRNMMDDYKSNLSVNKKSERDDEVKNDAPMIFPKR